MCMCSELYRQKYTKIAFSPKFCHVWECILEAVFWWVNFQSFNRVTQPWCVPFYIIMHYTYLELKCFLFLFTDSWQQKYESLLYSFERSSGECCEIPGCQILFPRRKTEGCPRTSANNLRAWYIWSAASPVDPDQFYGAKPLLEVFLSYFQNQFVGPWSGSATRVARERSSIEFLFTISWCAQTGGEDQEWLKEYLADLKEYIDLPLIDDYLRSWKEDQFDLPCPPQGVPESHWWWDFPCSEENKKEESKSGLSRCAWLLRLAKWPIRNGRDHSLLQNVNVSIARYTKTIFI